MQKSFPEFSVIVTCYNQAKFLVKTIDSILQQSYQNFEIIIINDGSQDDSMQVIADIQKQSSRIRHYCHDHNQNLGIFLTYRLGIDQAKGKYLAFLEGDDQWSPWYLEKKSAIFANYPQVGVIFSPYNVFSTDGCGKDMILRQWLLKHLIVHNKQFDNFANLLKKNNVATFSTFAMRKQLFHLVPAPKQRILFYDWWVLTHASIHTSFYYDTTSFSYWRHHRQSTLRKSHFIAHQNELTNFMKDLYLSIENVIEDNVKKQYLQKKKQELELFLQFYKHPALSNFWHFFCSNPLWALESIVSYLVNYYKFRTKRHQ